MIDRTLLYRCPVVLKRGRGARRRAGNFSPYDFRNNGKHGKIERKFTFAVPSVFLRTIHERKPRSLFHRVFHERGTFVIYVRCSVSFFTFVVRTWFTFAVPLGSFYGGLCSWITFAVPYSVGLNIKPPFNLHERGLETERGTNVELLTVPARNSGTVLFYHSFYNVAVGNWMLFRISPWEGFTAKTDGTAIRKARTWKRFTNVLRNSDTVFYVRFLNLWGYFTNALRNNERGVMGYEVP